MRSLLLALVALSALCAVAFGAAISSANTNAATPQHIVRTQCSSPRIPTAVNAANNNNCVFNAATNQFPLYYISNACDPASALIPFPRDGLFPGSSIAIPQYQYVCAEPTAAQAAQHTCVSDVPGTCPTYPEGNAASSAATDAWAVPRHYYPYTSSPVYPELDTGSFTNFPTGGADGTYIYPVTIPALITRTSTATSYGTAFLDAKCRSNGPANARAVICTDGTNQNYYSSPLLYGFSPASRNASTFMTYGTGLTVGTTNNLFDGTMHNSVYQSNYAAYLRYKNYAAANNDPLPAFPQLVTQSVKPVYSFDAFAQPTPGFVKIANSVDIFVSKGIERKRLINENIASFQALFPSATQSQIDTVAANTFKGFYKGEFIGISSSTTATFRTVNSVVQKYVAKQYYAGSQTFTNPASPPNYDTSNAQTAIAAGYPTRNTWTGCYGHGSYLPTESAAAGTDVFNAFVVGGAITPGFTDPRYTSGSASASLPGPAGTSFPAAYTCYDWTFSRDRDDAGNAVNGAVGDPGVTAYVNGYGSNVAQPYVYTWLSDGLAPLGCSNTNINIYCSWYPTNVDGVQNGDETGVDCGGNTVGADNEGLPTPSCGCTAGHFYDYYHALCIPCIQDTYCDSVTGCLGECYPCFTAPTSGAALTNAGTALFPNHFAQPNPNNLNSNDQDPGFGGVVPQAKSPKATPYGEQFNVNENNFILVGTTFNQVTQKYDKAATRCYCNIGFTASTNTATVPGTPLTVDDADAKFANPLGWEATDKVSVGFQGFKSINAGAGPFDGSNCVPVVRGDPQITGLQGQDFQVHGIPDEFFNMVSHPDLQVNARFAYLESARCDNFTTCFSHAGTYIDQIGMQIGAQKVKVTVGSLEEGLRVFVDGQEIKVGEKRQLKAARVFFSHQRKVHIRTPLFSFAFLASDKFMNQEVALLDGKLAKLGAPLVELKEGQERPHQEIPLHGIVGQTWQNLKYPADMFIEGAVADYRIEESDLFGNTFAFNKFAH